MTLGRTGGDTDPAAESARHEPSVSAIVPTYQRRDALPRVVDALLGDPALDELVVAVDGSTDGSLEWLLERRHQDDRLTIAHGPNGGIAAARQTGLEAARGDVVLLLDDDVIPAPGLVDGHRRHHARAEGMLVQGYMPNRWNHLPAGRRGIGRIYREAYDATCDRYERVPEHVLLGFWAGNFSLRRQDALRVGIAQPGLTALRGQEDREFGIRCRRAGLYGRFDRSLRAEHLYERGLDDFRCDCRRSGRYRSLIHDLHPDVVGPDLLVGTPTANTLDLPAQRAPRPLRTLWPRLASDPMYSRVGLSLEVAFKVGVTAGSLRLETLAARVLGSLETQRGVLDYTTLRTDAVPGRADAR